MRTQTWQTDFWSLLDECRPIPFRWGTHDCVIFAQRVVEVVTGKKIMPAYVWSDEDSALAIIASHGGLRELVSDELGDAVNVGNCAIGDIIMARTPIYGDILCVHDGVQIIGPGLNGLRRVPWEMAVCGWRI